ncbi:unnamed protein product [Brassica oleracea]
MAEASVCFSEVPGGSVLVFSYLQLASDRLWLQCVPSLPI